MSATSEQITRRLTTAISGGNASHAYFVSCPDSAESAEIARRAASAACLGSNDAAGASPDLYEFDCAKLRMDDVRKIVDELSHRPKAGLGRAIVLYGAHNMGPAAQDALLKSIEEPPAGTVFILTGNADGVLPTVLSRCCVLRLGLPGKEDVRAHLLSLGASKADAELYSALSCGSIERGARLYEDEAFRALRLSSIDALMALLLGDMPLARAKALAPNADEAAPFMLSAARDMLMLRCGLDADENADERERLANAASRFTIGTLTCIIELLAAACAALGRAAKNTLFYGAVMNRLFLDISEVIDTE